MTRFFQSVNCRKIVGIKTNVVMVGHASRTWTERAPILGIDFDIRHAEDDLLIRSTDVRLLRFPDRDTQLQVVVNIEGCIFETPGLYLVELYCDNTWVADTTIRLREAKS